MSSMHRVQQLGGSSSLLLGRPQRASTACTSAPTPRIFPCVGRGCSRRAIAWQVPPHRLPRVYGRDELPPLVPEIPRLPGDYERSPRVEVVVDTDATSGVRRVTRSPRRRNAFREAIGLVGAAVEAAAAVIDRSLSKAGLDAKAALQPPRSLEDDIAARLNGNPYVDGYSPPELLSDPVPASLLASAPETGALPPYRGPTTTATVPPTGGLPPYRSPAPPMPELPTAPPGSAAAEPLPLPRFAPSAFSTQAPNQSRVAGQPSAYETQTMEDSWASSTTIPQSSRQTITPPYQPSSAYQARAPAPPPLVKAPPEEEAPRVEAAPQQAEGDEGFNWFKNWWPIMPVSYLDRSRPTPVTLLGLNLVIWWDSHSYPEGRWQVFADVCPHRLAPLSEGRIDQDGRLQCAYHGWSFAGSGNCTRVPQAVDAFAEATACNSPRSCATTYPSQEKAGLLFVWPEAQPKSEHEAASSQPAITVALERFIQQHPGSSPCWYMRELPYSWDMLVENVTDPSHPPFSHHTPGSNIPNTNRDRAGAMPFTKGVDGGIGAAAAARLASLRSDGRSGAVATATYSSIGGNDAPLYAAGASGSTTYADTLAVPLVADPQSVLPDGIPGREPEGQFSFRNPDLRGRLTHYLPTLSVTSNSPPGATKEEHLQIYSVPVSPTKSKAIICSLIAEEHTTSIDESLPAWKQHLMYNLVFDQDCLFLHMQETTLRQRQAKERARQHHRHDHAGHRKEGGHGGPGSSSRGYQDNQQGRLNQDAALAAAAAGDASGGQRVNSYKDDHSSGGGNGRSRDSSSRHGTIDPPRPVQISAPAVPGSSSWDASGRSGWDATSENQLLRGRSTAPSTTPPVAEAVAELVGDFASVTGGVDPEPTFTTADTARPQPYIPGTRASLAVQPTQPFGTAVASSGQSIAVVERPMDKGPAAQPTEARIDKIYYMPCSSDLGVATARRWLEKVGGPTYADMWPGSVPAQPPSVFSAVDKRALLDRHAQHTRHCPDCKAAEAGIAAAIRSANIAFKVVSVMLAVAAYSALGPPSADVLLGEVVRRTAVAVMAVASASLLALKWAVKRWEELLPKFHFVDFAHAVNV